MSRSAVITALSLLLATAARAATTAPTSQPGVIIHTISSDYQRELGEIHVLLPDRLDANRRYPVLYVLPVYANHKPAAAAIAQARAENLHNRFDLICVTPSFDAIPWYVDHPTDARNRQESHLLHAVLPFVEKNYPALAEPRGRLLVGFSKSGWGAFTLLLRHPETFGRAASFDAPLMMGRGGSFGPPPPEVVGPPDHFAKYRALDLLEQRADLLRTQPARLAILGRGRFADDERRFREHLLALDIPHHWDHDTERKHGWTSGWLTPAVEWLTADDPRPPAPATQGVGSGHDVTGALRIRRDESAARRDPKTRASKDFFANFPRKSHAAVPRAALSSRRKRSAAEEIEGATSAPAPAPAPNEGAP